MSEDLKNKINPFIPNPKAFWCYKCKAHHCYNYSSSTHNLGGTRSTTETYSCTVCKASMFCPAQTLPWMRGLNWSGFILLIIGLMRVLRDFEDEIAVAFLGFAIFFLFFGGMMFYYLRKWISWSSTQKKKSAEELEEEAMTHGSLFFE
ncbi:MAG: hypothetical protein VYB73_04100 [Verrucomicrobiota bacterium]|nr:hypothetical protein [Verrucomicrobiota bacterium]